ACSGVPTVRGAWGQYADYVSPGEGLWTIGRLRGRVEGERHADLRPAAVAVVHLEALRHLGDQRQPEPEAGAVGARQHPAALIGHDHDDALVLAGRADLDGAGLVAVQ